jgi:hypothetical protein
MGLAPEDVDRLDNIVKRSRPLLWGDHLFRRPMVATPSRARLASRSLCTYAGLPLIGGTRSSFD